MLEVSRTGSKSMNDRMAELFGQAGISDSINEEFGIEYLAELIVLECASIVENQGRFLPYLVLSKEVKKRFGIKE